MAVALPREQVYFDTTGSWTVTFVSDHELTATAPSFVSGTVNVKVKVGSQYSPLVAADQFTYGPTVSAIYPRQGLAAGGTVVTIHGSGFTAGRQ